MTLAEFKAWLEGFEASFSEPKVDSPQCWDAAVPYIVPNVSQYAAIKAKLALVGNPVVMIPQVQRVDGSYQDLARQYAGRQELRNVQTNGPVGQYGTQAVS